MVRKGKALEQSHWETRISTPESTLTVTNQMAKNFKL